MRQVFIGWGVAVKRKAAGLFTIYFPHPLLHMRTSHNVEGLLFMVTTLLSKTLWRCFYYAEKANMERKNIGIYGTSCCHASGTYQSSGN